MGGKAFNHASPTHEHPKNTELLNKLGIELYILLIKLLSEISQKYTVLNRIFSLLALHLFFDFGYIAIFNSQKHALYIPDDFTVVYWSGFAMLSYVFFLSVFK